MSYQAVLSEGAWSKIKSVVAALGAGLMTTACAGSGGLGDQNLALLSSDSKPQQQAAAPTGAQELMKATEYWRKAYMKAPKDKDTALSYARNLKALGQKKKSLAVLATSGQLPWVGCRGGF